MRTLPLLQQVVVRWLLRLLPRMRQSLDSAHESEDNLRTGIGPRKDAFIFQLNVTPRRRVILTSLARFLYSQPTPLSLWGLRSPIWRLSPSKSAQAKHRLSLLTVSRAMPLSSERGSGRRADRRAGAGPNDGPCHAFSFGAPDPNEAFCQIAIRPSLPCAYQALLFETDLLSRALLHSWVSRESCVSLCSMVMFLGSCAAQSYD